MAGRIFKTIFDVVGRDSGASGTANRVTKSINMMSGAAMRSKAHLGGMSAQLSKTQKVMQRSMSNMMIGGGFLKMGSSMLDFIGSARDHAADLEYELATLKGISGASADELDRLAQSAQAAGIATQFTPTQAVQGLQALAQQGFTTEQQLDSLNSVLMLSGASGGKVPLNDAAKLTTQTLKAFGLEANKSGITVDRLVKMTTMSGLAIEELAEALQNGSSGAISLGISLEDTMATMGLIKNIIPSAAMAGSAFQILTTRMSNPMIQKKIKQTLGVDVVDKATGQYRKFSSVMVEISKKMEGLTPEKRGAFITSAFGARAQKGIAAVFTQLKNGVTTTTGEVLKGQEAFDYYLNSMDEDTVKGFAQAMNDMKLDTLHGQMELMSGSLQTFQIELGKGTAAISKSLVKYGLKAFNTFLEFFMKLPAPVKNAVSGFIALSGILVKVIGGFFVLKGLMSLVGLSFGGLLLTIGKVIIGVAVLAPLLAGIGVGIYGIYRMISKNFGKAGDDTATFFEKMKLGYRAVTDLISTGALSKAVIEDMKKAKFQGVADFIGKFGEWLANAKKFFAGFVQGFDDGLSRLQLPWMRFKETIGRIFEIWTGGSSEGIRKTADWTQKGVAFGDVMSELSGTTLELATRFLELGESISKSFEDVTMEDVVDDMMTLVTVVQKVIHGIAELIRGFKFVGQAIGEGAGMWANHMTTGEWGGEHSNLGRPEEMSDAATQRLRGRFKRFKADEGERIGTLEKGKFFEGQGGKLRELKQQLFKSAQRAHVSRMGGEEKHAQQLEKKWESMIEQLERKLVTAAQKTGELQQLKLYIGEEEFGRLVKQAGIRQDEDNYDSPEMAGGGTIPVTTGG